MELEIEIEIEIPPKNLLKLKMGLSWSLTLLYHRSSFLIFVAPIGAQGVTLSVCLSVCLSGKTC